LPTLAGRTIELTHTPRQFWDRLRFYSTNYYFWTNDPSYVYIPRTYDVGAYDGFRAVLITDFGHASPSDQFFEYLIVALWLPDGSIVPPSVLLASGALSGSSSFSPVIDDEASEARAVTEWLNYLSAKESIVGAWCSCSTIETDSNVMSILGGRLSVRSHSWAIYDDSSYGYYFEHCSFPRYQEYEGEDPQPTSNSGFPPGLSDSSSVLTGGGGEIAAAIREIADRDLTFSFGNGGPYFSWSGKASGS
jgi:hypothetical protein